MRFVNAKAIKAGIKKRWKVLRQRYARTFHIHVDAVWLDHYEGGMLRVEADHKFSMAALVVAKKYIGPMGSSKATAPPPAKVGVVTTINRNTLDDVHPCPAEKTGGRCLWSGGVKDDYVFRYMFTQWCGGIYCSGINSLVMWSGGESYNGPAMGFSFDTRLWSRVSDLPTVINGHTYNDDPTYNVQWGMFPDGVMAPPHSYDCLCYMPPEMGGGPKGSLITPTRNVTYGNGSSKWAVRCDLSTGHWHKAAANASPLDGDCPSWVLDPVRRRYLGVPGGESPQIIDRVCTLTFGDNSGIGMNATGPRFPDAMAPTTPCMVLGADRLALVGGGGKDRSLKLCAFDADALDQFYTLNVERIGFPAGTNPGGMCIGMGLTFCPDTGEFWGLPAAASDYAGWGDPTQATKAIEGLIRIIPPATGNKFTGAWKAVFVPIRGATGYVVQGIWKRFMYHPPTKTVCWASSTSGPVYSYKVI